jgi:hypothetical protein
MILEPKLLQARRLVHAKKPELQDAEAALKRSTQRCMHAFTELGATKLDAMRDGLVPFHETFSKLRNVSLRVEVGEEGVPDIDEVAVAAAGRLTASVADVVGAAAAAGASGLLAGTATVGAVGAFGTASTGTAIGSLSGAAATNATLAWLGGGSLAAGGGGVALGTTVLGGIVAAPVVLVGGVFIHLKGREAMSKAETFASEVGSALAQHHQRQSLLKAATKTADGIRELLNRLLPLLIADTGWLAGILERTSDWTALDSDHQQRIRGTAALAMGISDLVHTPVLDESGALTSAIRAAYNRGQALAGEASS